jgi:hypothetical protein
VLWKKVKHFTEKRISRRNYWSKKWSRLINLHHKTKTHACKISKKSVSDYLAWEVSTILNNNKNTKDKKSFKVVILLTKNLQSWGEYKIRWFIWNKSNKILSFAEWRYNFQRKCSINLNSSTENGVMVFPILKINIGNTITCSDTTH